MQNVLQRNLHLAIISLAVAFSLGVQAPSPAFASPVPQPVAVASGDTSVHKPATTVDASLLSVIKDLAKAARESDDVKKLENGAQKTAVRSALEALDVALTHAAANANRILPTNQKDRYQNALTAEAWDSGMLTLPSGGHASLSVLWGKKVDGLINIEIAGNCGCKADSSGARAGEYVVVMSGKSTLDSGFDIQTQSDVSYWLGKLSAVNVDATNCAEGQTKAAGPTPVLKAARTDDSENNAVADIHGEILTANLGPPPPPAQQPQAEATTAPATGAAADTAAAPHQASAQGKAHPPSVGALVVAPDRVIAGTAATIAIMNGKHVPEPFVELTVNGASLIAAADGRVIYQIPDEAAPGPSLQVALKARPQATPVSLYVIQPLTRPATSDAPIIDHVTGSVIPGSAITIDGHNFDGNAEHNVVLVDDTEQGQVLVSSPVQIKALLPASLAAGSHAITVTTNGLRSNATSCELVAQATIRNAPAPTAAKRAVERTPRTAARAHLRRAIR